MRRISITNTGDDERTIDITSYAELALVAQSADIAHPAFAKLFVETEYLADSGAILATRRRRTPTEPTIWAAHLVVGDGTGEVETDRARFLGRGNGVRDPAAMAGDTRLSGTVGTVLDPIFAVRRRLTIAPGAMVQVAFWTIVAASRDEVVTCIDKHRDPNAFARASMMAWTQAQVQLRHLGITPADADQFQRLSAPSAPWHRWTSILSAPTRSCCWYWHRHSTRAHPNLAISRATHREFARMAASTPMPHSGR